MQVRLVLYISLFLVPLQTHAQANEDYQFYHQQVIQAETFITEEKFEEALAIYEQLFDQYDFIFLREYQVASQVALYLKQESKAIAYIEKGILSGWNLKSIQKNEYLSALWTKQAWKDFKKAYPEQSIQYENRLNQSLQDQLKKMFAKDQKEALRVFLRIGSKAKKRCAENKFAPHSIEQINQLNQIIDQYGYPGDRLIGPNYWTSTIISHHNSISPTFNQQDQLYPAMKTELQKALETGYLAPAEWALMDEWYRITTQSNDQAEYGLIKEAQVKDLEHINQLRAALYLRTAELRNQLIDVEQATGMNFYLPKGWISGKIAVKK